MIGTPIISTGNITIPDDYVNITASGELIAYQGYAGKSVINSIGVNGGGKDPKDDTYYSMMTNKSLTKYQLLGFLESSEFSGLNGINKSYAAVDLEGRTVKVLGSSLGILMSDGTNLPIQTENNDVDIINTSNEYTAQIDNINNLTGTGGNLQYLEPVIESGGVYESCNILLNKHEDLKGKDGIYLIKISNTLTSVYCDMTTDGGGWTLFYANNGNADSIIKESYTEMRWNMSQGDIYELDNYNNEILASLLDYSHFTDIGSKELLINTSIIDTSDYGIIKFNNSFNLNWALSAEILGNGSTGCEVIPGGGSWQIISTAGDNYEGLQFLMTHYGGSWGVSHSNFPCNGYSTAKIAHYAFYIANDNRDETRARWSSDTIYRYFIR